MVLKLGKSPFWVAVASIFLALLLGAAMATHIGCAPRHQRANRAVAKLRAALRQAHRNAALGNYLDEKPNPYAPVLELLRRNNAAGAGLPRLWRARAMARYASFLCQLFPYQNRPHSQKWYRQKACEILHGVVRLCPEYTNGWVRLICLSSPPGGPYRHLAQAYRNDPKNPSVNVLRALEIMNTHGGIPPPGPWKGNMGFSPKWAGAFCYRALIYLRYRKIREERRVFGPGADWESFFTIALNYYEPKQLAKLDAGVWKPPATCPDPWPPLKKAAKAPTMTRP